MYNLPYLYQYPYYSQLPMSHNRSFKQWIPITDYQQHSGQFFSLKDYGSNPFVINIHAAAKQNNNFRTTLWTGDHLQLTLMSINPGEDVGLEIHPHVDQFLRVEQGQGFVQMGKNKDHLNYTWTVFDDSAIFIPAGTWHNITNIGTVPLKMYSIYAPPNHSFGTIHHTKVDSEKEHISHINEKHPII